MSGFPLVPALVAASLGFAASWMVLSYGQPHEDAFILFKYARNLAEGHGIVYYPGGPHAEGATDFLWMITLAGLHRLGVDVAIGAAILNALGAGLLAFVMARFVPIGAPREHPSPTDAPRVVDASADLPGHALRFLPIAFLFMGPALAGYWGFSATLYAGLCAWIFVVTLAALVDRRSCTAIPILALVLALFRPDGVIVGGAFAVLGLVAAWRASRARARGSDARRGAGPRSFEPNSSERSTHPPHRSDLHPSELRTYLRRCAFALFVALVYLVWRRVYFGLPLPLPLYVKGHFTGQFSLSGAFTNPSVALVGLGANGRWATSWDGPLPILCGTLVLVLLAGKSARRALVPYLACLVPGALLIASLFVAWQSQNIGSRFQAPAQATLLAGLFFWAGRALVAGRGGLALLVTALALSPAVFTNATNPRARIWNVRGYVDTFAVEMGHILPPERRIALTEAGRLSYWTSARVEDLVGLNTARTALAPAEVSFLEELDPDVVLFYADPFDLRGALGIAPGDTSRPLIAIDCDTLQRGLRPNYRAEYENPGGRYTSFVPPEKYAAMTTMRFLCAHPEYEIHTVLHLGNYSHVWAFKKDLPERAGLLAALRIALEDTRHLSYREALLEQ